MMENNYFKIIIDDINRTINFFKKSWRILWENLNLGCL